DGPAGDREVRPATYAERFLGRDTLRHVRQDRRIGNLLDEAQAERRRGDPEDDVPVRKLCLEIRLGETAVSRAVTSGHREQCVNAAIRRSVTVQDESHFTYRPVRRDERRDRIRATVFRGGRHLRVYRGTGTAHRRLRMATGATVQVHPGTETPGEVFRLFELVLTSQEVLTLLIRQSGNGITGASGVAAHCGILSSCTLRRHVLPLDG